jgi:hypothetical protein
MASAPCLDAEAVRVELQNFSSRLNRVLASATRMREADFSGFFSGLAAAVNIARVAQAELDRRVATGFSIFDYFHERETDLSRVFGGLLNPAGNHGQGSHFLGLFLNEICRGVHEKQRSSFPTSNFKGCCVHFEYVTDEDRRIDIVLQLPGNRWVGIENKPWAAEQERQVADYLQYLRRRAASTETGDAWLVYLSGDGRDPETLPDEDEERERCVTMGYRVSAQGTPSAEEWIRQCLRECEAERVRWFLKDLLEYLRRSFEAASGSEA